MSVAPNLDSRIINSPQHESLTGVVERLTYHSSESGYSVARLKANGHKDLVTIVGSFPNIQAGQTLKLIGVWREHPKFGPTGCGFLVKLIQNIEQQVQIEHSTRINALF